MVDDNFRDDLKQNLEVVRNTLMILLEQEQDEFKQRRLDECIRLLEKWF